MEHFSFAPSVPRPERDKEVPDPSEGALIRSSSDTGALESRLHTAHRCRRTTVTSQVDMLSEKGNVPKIRLIQNINLIAPLGIVRLSIGVEMHK